MLRTFGRERLALPTAPALLEPQPRQASHQIQLRRPHIAPLYRVQSNSLFGQHDVLAGDPLPDGIVDRRPELDLLLANAGGAKGLRPRASCPGRLTERLRLSGPKTYYLSSSRWRQWSTRPPTFSVAKIPATAPRTPRVSARVKSAAFNIRRKRRIRSSRRGLSDRSSIC